MWSIAVFAAVCAFTAQAQIQSKVFCYYDSRSYVRETQAKMMPLDLDPAMTQCTHLLYGYSAINPDTFKMVPLNENLDLDQGHGNYRVITNFKNKFSGLKVLLSVGGGADDASDGKTKYNALLESPENRQAFINSAILIAKNYKFDGIDLAWEFPETKPKRIRNTVQRWWHGFKKIFGSTPIDDKEVEHREGFTALVREFRSTIRNDHTFMLTTTVLPNVNSTIYHDVHALIPNLDAVVLGAFDFATPQRNPQEADYSSAIYELHDRNHQLNVEFQVNYWLRNGAPGSKLILGVPTFGRSWKTTTDSQISGVPPVTTDGPAEEGPYTKVPGLLSYPEICTKLNSPTNTQGFHAYFRKVTDPSKRFGTYAFRLPNDSGEGLWVSYEDPDSAGNKASYARAKGLAGAAVFDLSLDDFRGLCTGDKYPILRAIKYRIN